MERATLAAIDSNVLAYAEGTNGEIMKNKALDMLERLPPESALIPVQALGELYHVLVRKANRSRAAAQAAVLAWGDSYPLIETSSSVLLNAMTLAVDRQLSTWDAVMLSAAADAGCRLLLSEDFQPGFTWGGVTVANPFAEYRHPLLQAMLS